jgi:proline iminopeptidase
MADTPKQPLRSFYPPIEPYNTGRLKVSDIHELYYEEVGNPNGKPIVFLHGGPGGSSSAWSRRFFDPTAYRVVLFDQRGCGKSTPFLCIEDNTTWHSVSDIEKLRVHLGIDKWVVFGGSWGSALSLAYSETHPERVKALIVGCVFAMRRKELDWLYKGASFVFPEAYEKFLEPIPEVERHDIMSAYYRRLTGPNNEEKMKCASAWTTWEMNIGALYVDPRAVALGEDPRFSLVFATMESHYMVHGAWLKHDSQLIDDACRLKDIPGVIVQGRYDMVCPAVTAYELKKNWPNAEFHIVPDAGHSPLELGIISGLVEAADKFRDL